MKLYFGGKSIAAPKIWERLGEVDNVVEPFFGSGAILLGSPRVHKTETVNDIDGFVCNAWRSIQRDPDAVAYYCDHPVFENDFHARHAWLVQRREELTAQLEGDPEYYDPKIAGYWIWGCCLFIGGGWCSGRGPWKVVDDMLLNIGSDGETDGVGQTRGVPHLAAGRGVHRTSLGDGVSRQIPSLSYGTGVHRGMVNLSAGHGGGTGIAKRPDEVTPGIPYLRSNASGITGIANEGIYAWMQALCERLRYVRVCCGDWKRVLGPTPTTGMGLTGVILDPPYAHSETGGEVYACDGADISAEVRAWALEHGSDKLMRIVICGYVGEHEMPGWTPVAWKAKGGYGNQRRDGTNDNNLRETLWFSPHCLGGRQGSLFVDMDGGQ